MTRDQMLDLIKALIVAVRTGECPDRTCEMCKVKWDTVKRAQDLLTQEGR